MGPPRASRPWPLPSPVEATACSPQEAVGEGMRPPQVTTRRPAPASARRRNRLLSATSSRRRPRPAPVQRRMQRRELRALGRVDRRRAARPPAGHERSGRPPRPARWSPAYATIAGAARTRPSSGSQTADPSGALTRATRRTATSGPPTIDRSGGRGWPLAGNRGRPPYLNRRCPRIPRASSRAGVTGCGAMNAMSRSDARAARADPRHPIRGVTKPLLAASAKPTRRVPSTRRTVTASGVAGEGGRGPGC